MEMDHFCITEMLYILLASAKMKNFVRISVAVRETVLVCLSRCKEAEKAILPEAKRDVVSRLRSNCEMVFGRFCAFSLERKIHLRVEIQPGSLLGSRLYRTRRQYPVRM